MPDSRTKHTLVLFYSLALGLYFSSAIPVRAGEISNGSVTLQGNVGLNTIPNARMDEQGALRAGISTGDPYNHAFIGLQISESLFANLRQSMLVSSIGEKPSSVYPGLDFKLRLKKESRIAPSIVLGMDSALGHRRFSSEYVALSKRWNDFDFTAGIAWGRMAGAGHIANPFGRFSSHFDNERDGDSEDAASPSDWFTGEEIGFFGGVEYFTPLNGLSFKADFNPDAYSSEARSFGFEKPAPWSIGLNYNPSSWMSFGASTSGFDRLMARLSFQSNPSTWNRNSVKDRKPPPLLPRTAQPRELAPPEITARQQNGSDYSGVLHAREGDPLPRQIGYAARHLANEAPPHAQTITVIPSLKGLRGKAVSFSRRDLEQAILNKSGSPEEVWQDTSFTDKHFSLSDRPKSWKIKFAPEFKLSLSDEETTHLYRTSVLIEEEKQWPYGFITGNSVRLNIADNLHRLARYKSINTESIRADADYFTLNRVNLERSFIGFLHTPLSDVHLALSAGYLEEMYAGYGGEILYRPFRSPFALGVDAWSLYKRDGLSALALGLYPDAKQTGHVTLYYQMPDSDLTTYIKAGKFIGGDWGAQAGARMDLAYGMTLGGYVTATNSNDKDIYGSDRNIIAGLNLSVPLGDLRFIPEGSAARIRVEPIGRDDGAVLDKPLDLYGLTEPGSYRHLGRNWQEVLK